MNEMLFIDGRRNGYSPKQCGETMTVGELIEELQKYDESMPVYLKNDEGYKELHYNRGKFSSSATLALNFANSNFSKIATSSIGETIEAYICSSTGEIFRFKNVTRGDVECL
jgi:hypothetical protein